jgi:hypothetical protein
VGTVNDRPTILAIDPGLTTGWANLDPDGGFRSGETKPPILFLSDVERMLRGPFPWAMVCERYVITPETIKKSRQADPLEIIGTLKYFAEKYQTLIQFQGPAEAKTFATDKKLKALGWFRPGLGHANDAARHLLCYWVKHGLVKPEALI